MKADTETVTRVANIYESRNGTKQVGVEIKRDKCKRPRQSSFRHQKTTSLDSASVEYSQTADESPPVYIDIIIIIIIITVIVFYAAALQFGLWVKLVIKFGLATGHG